jgi:hypothetical protein
LAGFNDLAHTNATLAAEWDLARNQGISPQMVGAGPERKVFWLCAALGHSWGAYIHNRSSGHGCPICANKQVLAGFNDLGTVNPTLSEQWDAVRNVGITPQQVTFSSGKRVFWLCSHGHSWEAQISNRSSGSGCPVCAGHQILVGFNDLGAVNPTLSEQWDTVRNVGITPQDVTAFSSKKAFWLCAKGHSWVTTIGSRALGRGCPTCAGQKLLTGFNDLATINPTLCEQWDPVRNGSTTPQQVLAGTEKKAFWLCLEGHSWNAQIASRGRGTGCPKCAKYGFNDSKPAHFYIAEHSEKSALKVGISAPGSTRMQAHQTKGWRICRVLLFADGAEARHVETQTLQWFRKELKLPTAMTTGSGWTETIPLNALTVDEILEHALLTATANPTAVEVSELGSRD